MTAQQPQRNLVWECKACGLHCVVSSAGYHNAPTCGCLHNSDIGSIWSTRPHTPAPVVGGERENDCIHLNVCKYSGCSQKHCEDYLTTNIRPSEFSFTEHDKTITCAATLAENKRVLKIIAEAKKKLSFDSSFATDNAYNEGRLSAFNLVEESLRQQAGEQE